MGGSSEDGPRLVTDFRSVVPGVRLYSGELALDSLAGEVARLKCRRAFIVCGRSVATRTGLVALVRDRLGPAYAGQFDRMRKDSPYPDVVEARDAARAAGADLLLAIGGGSVMQATRVVAILLAEPGDVMTMITQYPEQGPAISPKLLAPKLPIINVCTVGTSATHRGGSAIRNELLDHRMEFFDPKTRPQAVFWDHRALQTAPLSLALESGFSIFCRALVNMGTVRQNPLVEGNRRQAFALADRALPRLLAAPDDPVPRLELCAAAWLQNRDADDGGTMFDKHWVQRVAYAFATALFIRFPQVSQGQANAAVTPAVMRAFGPRDPRATANMAVALGVLDAHAGRDEVAQAHHLAADAFEIRTRALGLPVRLSQLPVQVPRDQLPLIVQDSLKNFNADPKREFTGEVERLREVIDAAW
jgi:alcohol dehydrogenase class IV